MIEKKIIIRVLLAVLILFIAGLPAFSETSQEKKWKKGEVTKVTENSVEIDGRTYYVSNSVIIRDVSNEVLDIDLEAALKGTEEILYRIEDREIVEIRIFKRRH